MSFGNIGNRRPMQTMRAGFGSPTFSSQTGARDPTRIMSANTSAPSSAMSVSESTLLSRRTDHLEKEVRPLKESITRGTSERNKLKCELTNSTNALYAEMQWVFAKNHKPLKGRAKWNDISSEECDVAKKSGSKLLLVYPMKKYHVPAEACEHPTTQFLMRCKTVNSVTGQISMHWVVVHEVVKMEKKEKHIRHVHDFSFA